MSLTGETPFDTLPAGDHEGMTPANGAAVVYIDL